MFVFDPNRRSPALQPAFAIDNGQVVIPKALIETATVQVLNAQTIVADEVKAGIAMTAPTLTGAVINGAELNVGSGDRTKVTTPVLPTMGACTPII